MKYNRFEELPVWKAAIELSAKIFKITMGGRFRNAGDIARQVQRAALSISNNIAEGFERGTTHELITFLYYARGSAGEVRSILCVIEQLNSFGDLRSEISNLKSAAESVSRQIRGWASALQNTSIRGSKHLNDKTKMSYEQEKSRREFHKMLRCHYQPPADS